MLTDVVMLCVVKAFDTLCFEIVLYYLCFLTFTSYFVKRI